MFFPIISFLIWPIIIIGLISFFVARKRRKEGVSLAEDKNWYLRIAFSREDLVSQFFFLFSLIFLGLALLALNRKLSDPLDWQTIVFFTSLIGIAGAYYFKVIYTLAFSLAGVLTWWSAQAMEWITNTDIKTTAILTGLMFIGLLFYLAGHLHEKELKWKRFSLVYLLTGLIAVTGGLFFLSTKPGLHSLEEMTRGISFFGSWQISLSLLLLICAVVGVIIYTLKKKSISIFEASAIIILLVLFGSLALLPEQNFFPQLRGYFNFLFPGNRINLTNSGILWAIIFNAFIFLELVGIIFSGYLKREGWLINLGALFLFILIIVKYFDWFFTFINKGLFFIGAGILLFVVGWFMERARRKMISAVKS